MRNVKRLVQWSCVPFLSVVVVLLLVGCQSAKDKSSCKATCAMSKPAVAATATDCGCARSCRNRVCACCAPRQRRFALKPAPPPRIPIPAATSGCRTRVLWMETSPTGAVIANCQHTGPGPLSHRALRHEFPFHTNFQRQIHCETSFCRNLRGHHRSGAARFFLNVAGHEFKDFDVWAKAAAPSAPMSKLST